jgi:RNA polymerase-binding transcription factor DksA
MTQDINHNHIHDMLTRELSAITGELASIATHNDVTGDWEAIPEHHEGGEADENVGADVVESWNERHATVAALEVRFRNVKRALEKIDGGTYGICEISGEPIEADRLAANPAARTCKTHMHEELQLPL